MSAALESVAFPLRKLLCVATYQSSSNFISRSLLKINSSIFSHKALRFAKNQLLYFVNNHFLCKNRVAELYVYFIVQGKIHINLT